MVNLFRYSKWKRIKVYAFNASKNNIEKLSAKFCCTLCRTWISIYVQWSVQILSCKEIIWCGRANVWKREGELNFDFTDKHSLQCVSHQISPQWTDHLTPGLTSLQKCLHPVIFINITLQHAILHLRNYKTALDY